MICRGAHLRKPASSDFEGKQQRRREKKCSNNKFAHGTITLLWVHTVFRS